MQLMMFERGEIELAGIPLPDIERITNSAKYRPLLHSEPDNAVFYCSMNCEMPPFDNQKLRQAFNYAVDKERICRILAGTAQPATGVLPPGMPGYNPDLKGYPYDPARAKQLLAEAGYPDGLEVELTTRSRPSEQRWAEVVMQNLRDIGVRCSIRSIAFPQWLDVSSKRKGLAFTINAWFQDYPDPSNFLDILLNGERITETNCNNRAFYNNPEVNQLLNQAAGMTDVAQRLKLYQQAEQRVVDDAPWIFVYYPERMVLVQPWVRNYKLHPVWWGRAHPSWFGQPEESAR
jgi:ABC-type transport system substrate-binding protein